MALISAAIGAAVAIGGWLGSTALGTIALNAAIGVGLSLVQQALFAPDSAQQRPPAGITGTMGRGGTEPRAFMVGRFATPGTLLYAGTFGAVTPNAHLCQAICLSDVPVNALTGIYVDGERCTIDWDNPFADRGYPIIEYRKDGKDNLWVKFYDGTQIAADPQMVSQFGADPDYPWDETAVVTGCAYAVMTARLERSLFSGFPQFVFELEGARWYDIRKDSTAGGTGTHRWNDFATWEYSENDAVISYNILRGVSYQGQWLYGLQTTGAAQFPYANWSAAMAVCDVQVAKLEGTGTEAQYRIGGEIRVDGQIIEPLKKLMTACEGRIAEVGGVYKIHIGAPDAPVLHITDDDIVSTQGQDFDPFRGLADQLNGIAPRYPNPVEAYQEHAGPTRWNDARIAAVGGRQLPTEVAYDFVPFKGQVQRLTAQQLAEYSRQRRHTLVLGPSAQILEPIDSISWTSARNGYVDKLFRVEGVEDLPRGDVRVQVVEVDPADYVFDAATQYQDDPDGPIIIQRPPAQPIAGWQVGPATIRDAANNARRPSIAISFEGDAADVKEVRVQVRLAATGAIVFDGLIPYGEPGPDNSVRSHTLNGTFLPATLYEVQGQFVPYSGRETTPSAWLPVTTPDIRLGALDVYFNVDLDQLAVDVKANLAWISGGLREIQSAFVEVSQHVIDQDWSNQGEVREIRREIGITRQDVTAAYEELISTVAQEIDGEIMVVSQRVETLEVEINGKAGLAITSALDARIEDTGDALISTGRTVRDILNSVQIASLYQSDQDWAVGRELADVRGIAANYFQQTSSQIGVTNSGLSAAVTRLEAVEIKFGGYATLGITDSLIGRVEETEDGIDVLGEAQQTIDAALSGYLDSDAVSSAFMAQSARITATEDDITAVASSVSGVEASVDAVSAGGSIKFEAAASPGGGWSRVGLYASADDGVTFEEAAIFLDARTTGTPGSRIAVVADQFVITDGTDEALPFVFQGGVAVMNASRINIIEAGIIRSLDGLYKLDLNTGIETWDDGT